KCLAGDLIQCRRVIEGNTRLCQVVVYLGFLDARIVQEFSIQSNVIIPVNRSPNACVVERLGIFGGDVAGCELGAEETEFSKRDHRNIYNSRSGDYRFGSFIKRRLEQTPLNKRKRIDGPVVGTYDRCSPHIKVVVNRSGSRVRTCETSNVTARRLCSSGFEIALFNQ